MPQQSQAAYMAETYGAPETCIRCEQDIWLVDGNWVNLYNYRTARNCDGHVPEVPLP